MNRTIVKSGLVMALLGMIAIGSQSSSAQDAGTAMATHPVVGVWDLAPDKGDGDTTCHSQGIFAADGSYTDLSCDSTLAFGVWEPTGPNTANLTFILGPFKVRVEVTVAVDGQSLTGTFTFEPIDPQYGAEMGQYGPATVTATRVVAEAPGTPTAPISDLFAQVYGTPEATPAP